jgi:ClpP class serine protease
VLGMLDAAYDIFFERVRAGRASTVGEPSRLRELADGSIFTAPQAKKNGLVDAIGYLDDAITEAEKRAKLTAGTATVTIWRERPTLLPSMSLVRRNAPAGLLDADRLRSLVNELGSVRLMYLRP